MWLEYSFIKSHMFIDKPNLYLRKKADIRFPQEGDDCSTFPALIYLEHIIIWYFIINGIAYTWFPCNNMCFFNNTVVFSIHWMLLLAIIVLFFVKKNKNTIKIQDHLWAFVDVVNVWICFHFDPGCANWHAFLDILDIVRLDKVQDISYRCLIFYELFVLLVVEQLNKKF